MTRLYFKYRYWTDQYGNRYTPYYQYINAYKDWIAMFDAKMKVEVIPEQYYKELAPGVINMDRVWYLDIDENKLQAAWLTLDDAKNVLQQIESNYFLRIETKEDIDNFVKDNTVLKVVESGKYLVNETTVENLTQEQIKEWENDPNVEYVDNEDGTYTVRNYIII